MAGRRPRRDLAALRRATMCLCALAPACTTEFPDRELRLVCTSDADCAGTDRCVELTPGDLRCWPEEVACADRPCPEPGGPTIIPIGQGDGGRGDAGPVDDATAAAPPWGGEPSPPSGPSTEPPDDVPCPQTDALTECPVDNVGFCVYEPTARWLPVPCVLLCGAAGLDCEGTSEDQGELCDLETYFPDCETIGAALACVCSR